MAIIIIKTTAKQPHCFAVSRLYLGNDDDLFVGSHQHL